MTITQENLRGDALLTGTSDDALTHKLSMMANAYVSHSP